MANIKEWLEAAVAEYGEPLEAIVVGKHDKCRWDSSTLPDENIILPPADGLKKLDVKFNNGFGSADCFPIYAWTTSRVFWIDEYDGATQLVWAPRNPLNIEPEFSGQPS